MNNESILDIEVVSGDEIIDLSDIKNSTVSIKIAAELNYFGKIKGIFKVKNIDIFVCHKSSARINIIADDKETEQIDKQIEQIKSYYSDEETFNNIIKQECCLQWRKPLTR